MGSFKNYALAGLLALTASTAAHAADLLPPPPPEPLAPVAIGGGWYLRGDIGMTNQDVDKLDFATSDVARRTQLRNEVKTVHLDFDSSPLFGLGVGYQFNNWLRADVTGEYRGKSSFHGLDRYDTGLNGTFDGTNEYRATKSEWVAMANVYFDLGTWYGITPFIGAGIGGARTSIDNLIDVNTPNAGVAFAKADASWDLAWALHAGLAYDVTSNLKVELAYRYINLGDAKTGVLTRYDSSGCGCLGLEFKDIDSHDFKVGMRWALGGPVMAASHAPVVRKY